MNGNRFFFTIYCAVIIFSVCGSLVGVVVAAEVADAVKSAEATVQKVSSELEVARKNLELSSPKLQFAKEAVKQVDAKIGFANQVMFDAAANASENSVMYKAIQQIPNDVERRKALDALQQAYIDAVGKKYSVISEQQEARKLLDIAEKEYKALQATEAQIAIKMQEAERALALVSNSAREAVVAASEGLPPAYGITSVQKNTARVGEVLSPPVYDSIVAPPAYGVENPAVTQEVLEQANRALGEPPAYVSSAVEGQAAVDKAGELTARAQQVASDKAVFEARLLEQNAVRMVASEGGENVGKVSVARGTFNALKPYGEAISLGIGSVLELGFDIAYELQENKNYQAFVNLTGTPVRIKVSYHTAACPKDDIFELTENSTKKNVLYPSVCQVKTITVCEKGTDKVLGSRALIVGQSGARHGNWELVKGAQGDQVFVRQVQSDRKFDPEYFQVIQNNLEYEIKVVFSYIACKNDAPLIVQPGGTAEGTPKGCLLSAVTVFNNKTNAQVGEYSVPVAASSQRHGIWQVNKAANGVVVIVPMTELVTVDEMMKYVDDVAKKIGIVGGSVGVVAAGLSVGATAAGLTTAAATAAGATVAGVEIGAGTAASIMAGISATGVGALAIMGTAAVLGIGVGIYYLVEKDKNYQAFTNLTKEPLIVQITYHVCKEVDIFGITPGDHRIVYPKACQPKSITILDKTAKKTVGLRTFNVGSDGARHGDWQLVQGATTDEIVVRERTLKSALQNVQWVENALNNTVTVRFVYRSAFCPHDDVLSVVSGGNAQADPKACLLKKIIVDGDGKYFQRDFALAAPGTQHGSWRVTPYGIEGPL